MAEYSIPNGAAGGNTAGDAHWKAPVANYASLPASGNSNGDTRVALDTSDQWTWNGSAWVSPTAGAIALTNSQIFVGNASNVATSVAMSGDVTISNTGVTTIGASKVTEAMQVLADNTTNDVSTAKHGYAPKAPNDATKYLDGTGAWSVPAGGGGGLSIGTVFQGFAASPIQLCDASTPLNAGTVQAESVTVDMSGNATINCSADPREYVKTYSVVGTSAQTGKAQIVASVTGTQIVCQSVGGDNELEADAGSSQLVIYGNPRVLGIPSTGLAALEYAVNASPSFMAIVSGLVWTGPIFNAGQWMAAGGSQGGIAVDSAGVRIITGLSASPAGDLVTAPVGDVSYQFRLVTGATDTLDVDTDSVIGVNHAGTVTITLPAASTAEPGKVFTIKDESGAALANAITLDLDGSDTMDGSATNPQINYNYGAIAFYSNGTNWFIV